MPLSVSAADLRKQHATVLVQLAATQHELERSRMAAAEGRAEAVALVGSLNSELCACRLELREARCKAAEAHDTAEFKVMEAQSMSKQLQVGAGW